MKKILLFVPFLYLAACGDEMAISALSSLNTTTSYLATVKDNDDLPKYTAECAEAADAIKDVKVDPDRVLGTVGVFRFDGTEGSSKKVAELSCVLAVEIETEVFPSDGK